MAVAPESMAWDRNCGTTRPGRRAVLAGLGLLATAPAWARGSNERYVRLICPETGESFFGPYWAEGRYLADAMRRIDWLMRDFHCDAVARIDPRLIDLLHDIRLHLGTRRPVSVISAFRTEETNDELRVEGMPAAEHSQHLIAHAADIAVDGVSPAHIETLAVRLRRGGVGGYDHHVHVDTGPVRTWSYHPHHVLHPHRRRRG